MGLHVTFAVFTVATAVALTGCGNAPKATAGEPSLQETQAWMHNFAAGRAYGFTRNGTSVQTTFEGAGCSTTMTWSITSAKDSSKTKETISFSLGDLDPNTAKAEPKEFTALRAYRGPGGQHFTMPDADFCPERASVVFSSMSISR